MSDLLREYVRSLLESYMQDDYEGATAKDLDLDKPGTMVEPEVRKKLAVGMKKMGLTKGKLPKGYGKSKVQPRLG